MTDLITNPKQTQSIIDSQGRWNIWEGSVRSGKTFASLIRFLKFVLTECPDNDLLIVGRTSQTIFSNIVKFYEHYFPGITLYQRGLQLLTLGTKEIRCVGASDERAYTKIAGSTLSGAYVDEMSLIPWSFIQVLDQRLSKPHSKMFATSNPDSPYHPLKEIIDKADGKETRIFKFLLEDNNHLSKTYIDQLKKSHTGLFYQRYILAQWVLAEGAIYDFFDESLHTIDEPKTYAKYYIAAVDYGTRNKFVCLLVGFNDDSPTGKIWIEKEYVHDARKMQRSKTDFEYAEDLQQFLSSYPVKMIYCDPSALSFITELRKRRLPVVQADNKVLDGIRRVATLLSTRDLLICSECKNLIKEIGSYVWNDQASEKGEDKPTKKNDDCVDAMRYAVFSHWPKGNLKKLSQEEKQFEQYKAKTMKNPMQQVGWGHGWQRIGGGSAF